MHHLNEKGQGLTEYLILLILVVLASVLGAQTMGRTIKDKMKTANRHLDRDINFEEVNK